MTLNYEKIAHNKSNEATVKIHEMLNILFALELPLHELTNRRLEKMAMSLLAIGNMKPKSSWAAIEGIETGRNLGTKEIIRFINPNFEEKISEGSYDDIRRKDLVWPVQMGLVIKSANNPNADNNDSTRGYALSSDFAELCRQYGTRAFDTAIDSFEKDENYIAKLTAKRTVQKIPVSIADGLTLELDDGPHNQIQKAIVEQFLPRFGYGAKLLYLGDASEKILHKFSEEMELLGLNVEDRGMLPDIVAFSEEKGWLYLIEAVHSSNPLNPERCIELSRSVLKDCKYGVVFVTAFLNRKSFTKWLSEIAWETEVWLADRPDHMIHFNGDKFMGPHSKDPY